MRFLTILIALLLSLHPGFAAEPGSAMDALKLAPERAATQSLSP